MQPEQDDGEMVLCFVNGSPCQLTVRELVERIHHRAVAATLMLMALLLATAAGDRTLGETPLWAGLVLNIFSVSVFLVTFPAFMSEAEKFARSRGLRRIFEPLVTVPIATLVTLATEALSVLLLGDRIVLQRELAVNLALGVAFWEIVVNILMIYVMPAIASDGDKAAPDDAVQPPGVQVRIGSRAVNPKALLRVESDDHFLVLHMQDGPVRILCRFRDAEAALQPHGIVVHRSHWVAYMQLGPIARRGRSLIMQTKAGDAVPVARDRRAAVEAARQKDRTA